MWHISTIHKDLSWAYSKCTCSSVTKRQLSSIFYECLSVKAKSAVYVQTVCQDYRVRIHVHVHVCNTWKSQNTAEAQSNYCTVHVRQVTQKQVPSFPGLEEVTIEAEPMPWIFIELSLFTAVLSPAMQFDEFLQMETLANARQPPTRVTCGCRWLFISYLKGAYLMG